MYQVPLRFIKVSPEVAICATRATIIMSQKAKQARDTASFERKAGTLVNACGRRACKSIIILDTGQVVSSPLDLGRLLNAIDKANYKDEKRYHTKRLRVFDVADKEPDTDIDSDEDTSDDYMDEEGIE